MSVLMLLGEELVMVWRDSTESGFGARGACHVVFCDLETEQSLFRGDFAGKFTCDSRRRSSWRFACARGWSRGGSMRSWRS